MVCQNSNQLKLELKPLKEFANCVVIFQSIFFHHVIIQNFQCAWSTSYIEIICQFIETYTFTGVMKCMMCVPTRLVKAYYNIYWSIYLTSDEFGSIKATILCSFPFRGDSSEPEINFGPKVRDIPAFLVYSQNMQHSDHNDLFN